MSLGFAVPDLNTDVGHVFAETESGARLGGRTSDVRIRRYRMPPRG